MQLDVCKNARTNGLDLTFVATGGGALEVDFRKSGVEFIRIDRSLPVDFLLAYRLRKIISQRNINLVHCHQPVEALHAYLATLGTRVKIVLTLHGVYAGRKNDLALKFLLPRMEARVVLGTKLAAWLEQYQSVDANLEFHIINNGVDLARLQSCGGNLRAELGLSADALLFGMVANFYSDRRKDHLTVCKALPGLFKHVPTAQFIFVGTAAPDAQPLFDECVAVCRKEGVSDRVHFLGQRADVADILGSLDLFVLSSRWEGSPIAVMEAMMLGVPTVLSDIGPLREVSGDGKYAVLFRLGDANDLCSKLIQLVNSPTDRIALSSSARLWTRQFSIENHIANLIKLYNSVVC